MPIPVVKGAIGLVEYRAALLLHPDVPLRDLFQFAHQREERSRSSGHHSTPSCASGWAKRGRGRALGGGNSSIGSDAAGFCCTVPLTPDDWEAPPLEHEDIVRQVNSAHWYHRFEVLPGIVTPGRCRVYAREMLDEFKLPADLTGLTALDIGAWDGAYAFELERRGATVTALEQQDPNRTAFNTAKALRQSRVEYVRGSVYDAATLLPSRRFDIVLFLGVYYHLKHPLLAFEQIERLLKDDGTLLIEGECLRNWAPTPYEATHTKNPVSREKGQPENGLRRWFPTAQRPSRLARVLADSDVPIALFYAGAYKQDTSNWFVPNLACIREWLATVGMELCAYAFADQKPPSQRLRGIAKRVVTAPSTPTREAARGPVAASGGRPASPP